MDFDMIVGVFKPIGGTFSSFNIGEDVKICESLVGGLMIRKTSDPDCLVRVRQYTSDQELNEGEKRLLHFVAERYDCRVGLTTVRLGETRGQIVGVSKDVIIICPDIVELEPPVDYNLETGKSLLDELIKIIEDTPIQEERTENTPVQEEREERTNMFNSFNQNFGKINSTQFKLSINGLAVRGKDGKYLTFNPETRELIEVTNGFFDNMSDLLFMMPAVEVEKGDIILHQNKPYYITSVTEHSVKGVDFEEAVESVLIPKTNVFGVKYFTKVFNCLGTNNVLGTELAKNPMMAYALMGGKDFDLSKIMMFQALSGQGKPITDFSKNPIMLLALAENENGSNMNDFVKMQLLSQIAGQTTKDTEN
mgnify:CR=1 FL=1